MNLEFKSVEINGYPANETGRILTFSPVYPIGHIMRHRIIDAQFVRFCTDVTHWVELNDINPETLN